MQDVLSIVVAVSQTKEIIQQTAFVTNNGTEVLFNMQKKEVAKRQCLWLTMNNVTFNNNFEKIRRYEFLFCQKYILTRTMSSLMFWSTILIHLHVSEC